MPDNFPTVLPTRQAIEAQRGSVRLKVTGKLKVALDLMVWSGEHRADAAAQRDDEPANSFHRFSARRSLHSASQ